jgi:hypothetical protein
VNAPAAAVKIGRDHHDSAERPTRRAHVAGFRGRHSPSAHALRVERRVRRGQEPKPKAKAKKSGKGNRAASKGSSKGFCKDAAQLAKDNKD